MDSLVIGALLRKTEQFRFVSLVAAVVVPVAQIGRLQIQMFESPPIILTKSTLMQFLTGDES